jgi:hypothetical protein
MPVTTEIGKYLAVMGSVVITGLAPQPYLEVGPNQRRVRLLEYYRSLQHSDFWELERPCGGIYVVGIFDARIMLCEVVVNHAQCADDVAKNIESRV